MSKKRKTKKEKMIAHLRRELQSSQIQNTYSLPIAAQKQVKTKPDSIPSKPPVIKNYSYVYQDMKHTLTIVAILLFFNALLFTLIQTKIIHLNM